MQYRKFVDAYSTDMIIISPDYVNERICVSPSREVDRTILAGAGAATPKP